jgi:hypothetical protein
MKIKISKLINLIVLIIIFLGIILYFFNETKKIEMYYCPQTDGYVGQIPDENIHDNGPLGGGDSLEIYCRKNIIRLCLSKEPCPWREDIYSKDKATCYEDYGNSPMAFSANEEGINIAKVIGTGDKRIENIFCNKEFEKFSPAWNIESLNNSINSTNS